MPKSRLLIGALTAATFGVASLFAAAPAYAASLPSGQKITVIDYVEDYAQFYDASPADATLAEVGTGQDLSEDGLAAIDVNDDGIGFALGNYSSDGQVSTLYAADAGTGVLSSPLQIMLDFLDVQVEAQYCSALDYSGGVLMAICYDEIDEQDIAYWGILDPTAAPGEAWLTPLYQFDGQEYLFFDSMAVDPISGLVYAVAYGDGAGLFTLSEDAGATFVAPVDGDVHGFDFDRGGQAWVTTSVILPEEQGTASALATLNLADGSFPFLEVMTIGGETFGEPFIQPITVWGHEALPATGPANPVVPITAAAIALLAGAILAGVTVLRRRSEDAA